MPGSMVKPVPGQQPAFVVRFVVVQVRAVAVHGLAEAVTRAMDDVVAVAGRLDDRPRRAIELEAADLAAGARGVLDQTDGGVARIAHGGERAAPSPSGTCCPVKPTQVMSAKTAPGVSSLPHRSSSSSSSRPDRAGCPFALGR